MKVGIVDPKEILQHPQLSLLASDHLKDKERETLPCIQVEHPHVVMENGVALIRDTKVPVRRLWMWFRRGVSTETLMKRYPMLGPAKVLSALSFAYDNQELIEAEIQREANRVMEG